VTENNVIMYLDMIHEKIIELKGVNQYLDVKSGAKSTLGVAASAAAAAVASGKQGRD
jgi:hypothetical protein